MKTVSDKVTVTAKDMNGKEVTESQDVSYPELETAEDFLTLIGTDAGLKQAVAAINYGLNLKARASVRAEILKKLEGPDKSVNKAVETLLNAMKALGRTMTEEQARQIVLASGTAS